MCSSANVIIAMSCRVVLFPVLHVVVAAVRGPACFRKTFFFFFFLALLDY